MAPSPFLIILPLISEAQTAEPIEFIYPIHMAGETDLGIWHQSGAVDSVHDAFGAINTAFICGFLPSGHRLLSSSCDSGLLP